MNKIFKVVWSKTKECYVVVSEVAKNNGGKKKVLASVLAGLAMVGAGAAGTPVQAGGNYGNSAVNIAPDNLVGSNYANTVSKNSVVVGYMNKATDDSESGKIIYGANNEVNKTSALAVGNENKVYAKSGTALGVGNTVAATAEASVAIGNKSKANADRTIAIGSGAEANGQQTIALGRTAKSAGENDIVIGTSAETKGNGDSIAIGRDSSSNKDNTITIGAQSKATGSYAVALGREAEVNANYANAMGYQAKANGSGSVAFGRQTFANGTSAVAVGTGAKVGDVTNGYEGGVAVGRLASAQAEHAAAIGNAAVATGKFSIASGDGATASAENAAAYGAGAQATNKQATAVGNASVASGENSSAFGYNNTVTGDNSTALGTGNVIDRRDPLSTVAGAVAVGNKNKASGDRAIAIGETNTSKVEDTITMGASNTANTGGGIAIGKNNTADSTASGGRASGNGQIAIGQDNSATNEDTIAIGRGTTASGRLSTAIGRNADATGAGSIAIGSNGEPDSHGVAYRTTSNGLGAVAFGMGAGADGKAALALGGMSKATADATTAVGYGAQASKVNALALGKDAVASIKDGVALGSESKTTVDAGQVGYNPAAGRTNKYDNLTNNTDNVLTSNRAAVAIGDDDAHITRQLTGLAAGKKDTDAVNVAQLRAVNLKYAGNSGNSDVRLENGTLNIKGEGLLSTSADATGITVKLTKGDDIAKDNGKAKEPTNNGVATTQNVVQAINNSYWKATAGGNTDGTPAVGNVKPGTQVTYSAGDNLKVKQTINNTTGDQEYKYSLNPVLTGITSIANTTTGPKMTFGSNSINITGGSLDMGTNKITNLAPGTADNDAVNVKQLKDTELHITPGTYTPDANKKVKLTYTDGNNAVVTGKEAVIDLSGLATGGTASTEKVKKAANGANDTNIAEVNPKTGDTFGGAGATYEVSVSRNAVKDAAREAVTVNNGGTTTGSTYTADTNNPISVTATPDNTNHNTTYAVTFDGNKAAKQIPLTYKATNGTTTTADQTVKLDKGLNFTGGDYTTASVGADGKVTFDVTLGTAPTVTDGKPGVPGQAGAAGKDGIATVKTVVDTINNSGWKANAKANGGKLDGSSTATVVKPGDQVNFAAGKNLTVKQDLTGEHTYTYSLNKDLKDLTSVEIGGSTIKTDGDHITITSPDTNPGATPGATVTNKVANLGDEKHIKPDNYAVANDGSVTLKYVDGNGKDLTETTKITGIAKKAKVINGKNTTVEEGTDTTDNSVTYKVNVKGDLADISSITNGTGSGKISFEGDQVVKVGGDHPISFDGKGGYVTGLQNKDWDITNPTVVSGRAATEDQLKKVSDGFNNTVKLTGNSGATGTQKLNQNGGLSFGVVGADNGKYITTTASGSNVVADLSTDAKAKLNSKVVVAGSGAATVGTPTVTTNPDGSTVTTYTVHVDPATATAASTESVVKKAVTGDTNIADVSVADGKATGDVGAKYEVSVSRNAVKDAAREAVTVNNGGTTKADGSYTADSNNPISVTPTKDDNNHNTSYAVTFDGNKAAKQIPLTYKATNGTTTTADQTVKLDKGLNFTGGNYTTASVGADGKVTFDVNLGTTPTVTDGKPGVPGQDGIATVKTVVDTINNSGWKANAKANGGKLDGSATATVVKPGNTVNYAAGKNLIVNQELEKDASNALTGNQTYTYSLNKDIDLTNAGSLTVGDTTVNNGGITIKAPTPAAGTTATTTDVKLTNTGLDNGGNTITNVAEGQNNTDAVNVKQLKANRTEVKAGDNVVVTTSADSTDNHTVYTVNAVTPAVYTTPDGTKLTKDKDGKFHKEDETAEYTGDIITSFENPKAATGQTTKDGGMIVNNIGSAIKNQTPTMPAGQTATYLDKLKAAADAGSNVKNAAVNVSDLHNTAEALKSNELHIRPTVTNRTGETVNQNAGGTAESYKYDSTTKSVTLKYNDGTGAGVTGTEAKIDLSDLANQITSGYTFKTNATENGGKVVNDVATPAAETAVANGGVVNYAAGKNLTVKQDIEKDATGAATGKQTYTYALADEIGIGEKGQPGVAGKDGVDGKIGVNGKDGSSVVINGKDGSIGMTGPQGQAGKDGINGHDGANISMTSAKGEQVLINRDPAHSADTDKAERIVYVPKDASGNPIQDTSGKNIVREVATMDDGLKFTGNNESTVNNHKLNTLVKVQGEGTKEGTNAAGAKEIQTSDGTKFESAKDNIAVEANNGDTLTVKLNKNLKGLDSVQTKTVELGDHTTPGGTTNITYNSGDKRIEYTTPGATGTPETKKVATTDDIWTIQGNGTDVAPVNGKVNVKAGENILITTPTTADGSMTINAVTPAVYTDKNGNKLTKDKDGKFHKDDGTEVAAADVITSIQDAAGNVTGGNSIVNNVGSAIQTQTGGNFLEKLDKATDTTNPDARPNAVVNVSDLKNTADGLTDKGLKFNANEGGVKTNKLGSKVTVQGTGSLTAGKAYADEYNTDNIRTKIEQGADGNTTINVGLAKALKDINSVSNGSSSITLNSNPGGTNNTPAVSITGGNVDVGGNNITNLKSGGNTDSNAANIGDVKKIAKDTDLHIATTAGGTNNVAEYTVDSNNKVTLTYQDGNGTAQSGPKAVIDLSALANKITSGYTFSTNATENGGKVVNDTTTPATETAVKNGGVVNYAAGKNLTVKQDIEKDGTGAATGKQTYTYSLADEIGIGEKGQPGVAGKDGVDGKIGVNGKDGSSVVINGKDGSIGMTGPQGQAGKDGINGHDGANISMTSAKGEQVLINRDPAHSADTDKAERIVYVPKDASGNPIQDTSGKNIVREVATMDDGMKYAGDDAQGTDKSKVIAKKLNKTLDIIGGADKDKLTDNNIGVNNDGNGKLKVQLSKEITGLTSVQIGGNTIKTDGDHITITSPDTTSGATPGSTVTNKVANLDDEMHIKDTEYTVGSDKKVRLTYVDGNGNPVDNKTAVIDLSGLPVGDKDTDMRIAEGTYTAKNGTVTLKTVNKDGTAANKDVVIKGINTDQYKAGDNVTFTPDGTDANGNPIYKINADLSGASSTEKVIRKNDTNNLAKVDTQSTHVAGDKGETYIVSVDKNDVKDAAREAVEVKGSGVIKVTADTTTTPHKTTYDVAYDPDKAAEVTKISYKSSTSPDAGSQGPKKVSLKDGFDFKSTGGNVKITTDNAGGIDFNVDLSSIHGVSQNIAVGGNVDPTSLTDTDTVTKGTRFDAGNNLVVKRTALNDTGLDHAISYELNKDLQGINSIRNANNGPVMNFNAGDIAISGGNLSMGDGTHNNKIVNVAPGTDKSDVATVGQLTKVVSSNGTVTIAPVYKDQDGAPVYDLSVTGVPGADPRVDQLAEEIGRVGAQGAALSALKPIQYDPLEPTQIMAGYGNYRGNSAVALGVAHYKNESTLIHGGVSWAGGSSHMMANAGVTWKVGNRDSEAAVADRYRKGPISSAYAMQQEMAAMKAQNAGLKGEVSDLKAENEQMKAQIAAMMAKLGL